MRFNVLHASFLNSGVSDVEGAAAVLPTSVENLAWATVSIQCFCWTSEKRSSEPLIGSGTALAPSGLGTEILATQPKFMFCDLVLKPNETKTCKSFNRSFNSISPYLPA